MSAAERQRRRRRRIASGLIRIAFDADETALVEMLIESGNLKPSQCEDRDAISAAVARLVASLVTADAQNRHA